MTEGRAVPIPEDRAVRTGRTDKNHSSAEKLARASVTVEASVVIPLTFCWIVLTLALLFRTWTGVWYTCAACEAVLSGNTRQTAAVSAGGAGSPAGGASASAAAAAPGTAAYTAAKRKAEILAAAQVMPGDPPQIEVQSGESGTAVSFSGRSFPQLSLDFSWKASASQQKNNPGKRMRQLYWIRNAVKS